MKRLSILHLGGGEGDAERLRALLAEDGLDGEVARAATPEAFDAALRHGARLDLIACDDAPPGADGLAALEAARRRRPDVPLLIVSSAPDEARAVEALRLGAAAYLGWDRPGRLAPLARRALREAEARAALARAGRELADCREAAEAAARAKERFLAVLSHELRTPLTPVLMAVSAMLDDPRTPAEVRPTLGMVRQNVELEARLIDDLLDVVLVAGGRLEHHREVVDAHDAIARAAESCRDALRAGRVGLAMELNARAHHVEADPARLRQVAWNLIRNAVKFTPGGGRLTIRSRDADGADGRPRLVVEFLDDGVGIAPEALPRIFDAFEQAESSPARPSGGLGLGLAIARALAEAYGGRLSAASPGPGRGSTFTLELAVAPSAPPPRPAPPPTPRDGPPTPPTRILLVEDDPFTATVLSRLLRRGGFDVTAAGDIASALEAAAAAEFDLVISDIGLPDGTGLDLMPRLRALRPTPGIALTGFGTPDDVRRSRQAGFAAHLTKPVDYAQLDALIRRLAVEAAPGRR